MILIFIENYIDKSYKTYVTIILLTLKKNVKIQCVFVLFFPSNKITLQLQVLLTLCSSTNFKINKIPTIKIFIDKKYLFLKAKKSFVLIFV